MALLAFLVSDCSQIIWRVPKINGSVVTPVTQYVCVDVPDAQMQPVKDGVRAWSRAIAQWKVLEVVTDDSLGIRCDYLIQETTDVAPGNENAVAWASDIGGHLIFLTKGRYEKDPTSIVLHEMGHALGAQHVAGTIMNESYIPGAVCPDVVTVAQVAAWNHVNLGLLSWCSR